MTSLYTAAAVILLPWIVYLAETLPRRQFDRHYRAAWVGFDLFLIFAIARTAYMAFRVDPRVQFPATATAVLLFVDAWFDIMTSADRSQFFEALVLALLVEIPAAVFSLYLARSVNRRVLELAHVGIPPLGQLWWLEASSPTPGRAVGGCRGGGRRAAVDRRGGLSAGVQPPGTGPSSESLQGEFVDAGHDVFGQ
jgi:hypothetical protein